MSFREQLKSEMEYQNLTTQELSNKSGVNKRTIDHYLMSDPQEPSVSNAVKIANALNVSIEYLVTGKDFIGNNILSKELIDFFNLFTKLPENKKKAITQIVKLFLEKD